MGTGAQNSFPRTVKEGVHSEMKISVFGLATANELRGGVTKKNAKRWDIVQYGGGWVKKNKKCPNFNLEILNKPTINPNI